MIVICTRCQARFRVPDDKVGPRGARIRCARCQTLFAVGPPPGEAAPAPAAPSLDPYPATRPAPEVELEAPARGALPEVAADDPFAGFRLDAGPPFGPPRAEPSVLGDPFGAAGDERGSLGAAEDPFAAGATAQVAALEEPPGQSDPPWGDAPFGRANDAEAERAGDPGALDPDLAWADDPYSAAISPRSARVSLDERQLPLTDLADLLGEDPRPPAVPPPLPPPREARAFPGGLDGGRRSGPDLALEERTTPPPAPLRAAVGDLLGDLPFPPPDDGFDVGPTELGAPAAAEEEPLALATEPERGLPEVWRTSPAFPPQPVEVAPPEPARAAEGPSEAQAKAATIAREARRTALRSLAVNALSLAALLVVALAFRVLWHGEGTAAAWSPSALLRAVRLGERSAASLETAGVTSGRYPREAGAPLLLVRGEVISRAPAPVARVRVDVEVVRDGRVLGYRSGLAGAVPTPEELHAVKDAAGLDALAGAISSRARAAAPGEPLPFLVAFDDVPDDLTGASVRVVASPSR